MRRRRKTEVRIETHEVLILRGRGRVVPASCARCGERARMVTPEEAAALAGVSLRTLYRRVEAGRVHFTESADGSLYICSMSLTD